MILKLAIDPLYRFLQSLFHKPHPSLPATRPSH
jgi:hypothetical protein